MKIEIAADHNNMINMADMPHMSVGHLVIPTGEYHFYDGVPVFRCPDRLISEWIGMGDDGPISWSGQAPDFKVALAPPGTTVRFVADTPEQPVCWPTNGILSRSFFELRVPNIPIEIVPTTVGNMEPLSMAFVRFGADWHLIMRTLNEDRPAYIDFHDPFFSHSLRNMLDVMAIPAPPGTAVELRIKRDAGEVRVANGPPSGV